MRSVFILGCLLLLAACGTDSTGGTTTIGGQTGAGRVVFTIKDAPLSQLQFLTIDITNATLQGIGGTPNFQVFPQAGSPASLTVDLLSLQGMGQLLSSAIVPAGTYNRLQIDYTNPQAQDFSSNPQVITSQTGFMNGMFVPNLVVTPGSLQSVLIDVDLSSAYHDQGGNQGFLTPTVQLTVLPAAQPLPLQRFFATVTAIDTQQDRFTADAFTWPTTGPQVPLGTVDVQCDANTTFSGLGGISIGNVTAQLTVNDHVEIEGVLLGAVIDASAVTLLGYGSPVQPAYNQYSGTIMDVDLIGSSVTVRVQWSLGNTIPPFTDVITAIQATTTIRRGPTPLALGDLTPGNNCHVKVDTVSGDTVEFEEAPSFICGTVVSVTPGGGAGGHDRIVFTPSTVNQIPVSALPFVPSPLTVDVPPGGPLPAVNGNFCVFAYFDGTSQLVIGVPGGGYTGPPPSLPPAAFTLLSGVILTGTAATVNASNEVAFQLVAFDVGTSMLKVFDVTVPAGAAMTLYASSVQNLATAQDAADAINQNPGIVEVYGSAAHVNYVFEADLALNVYAGPNQGGPATAPSSEYALGFITSAAVLNGAGALEFTMQGPTPGHPDWQVTVPATASIEIAGGTNVGTITAAQAESVLNASPVPFLHGKGVSNGTAFDGNIELKIYP
jgi:hypothetical protein